MKANLSVLLNNIYQLRKKNEEINKLTLNRFNIFKVLKIESKEVKLHSAFIAELLNPKGLHDMNDAFLQLFIDELKSINISTSFLPNNLTVVEMETSSGKMTAESGGRIDIILKDSVNNCIIIENKIYAPDQENQLLRYYNYEYLNKELFYLTLYGTEPSEKSAQHLKSGEDYYCISYKEFIFSWLSNCYSKSINHPKLRETIIQYLNLIRQLTGENIENMKESEEIFNEVGKSIDNALGADVLVKNWVNIKYHTEWHFWDEFYKKLQVSYKNEKWSTTFTTDNLNSVVHGKRNRNIYFGIDLELDHYNKQKVFFSVERGGSNICFGITVFQENLIDCDNFQFKELHTKLNKEFKEGDITQYWTFVTDFAIPINFESFNTEETIKLINPAYRNSVIQTLVNECIELVNVFKVVYKKEFLND